MLYKDILKIDLDIFSNSGELTAAEEEKALENAFNQSRETEQELNDDNKVDQG